MSARRRLGLCAATVFVATSAAAAPRSTSLVVRSAAPDAAQNTLATALATIPVPPKDIHRLLGRAQAIVLTHKAIRDEPALAATLRQVERASGPAASYPLGDWFVLDFETQAACDAALAILSRPDSGCFAEAVRGMTVDASSPRRSLQPDIPSNIVQVRAPEAQALVTADTSLIVAVIDTGADLVHPDLVRRIWHNDDAPGNANPADDTYDQNGDGSVEDWERDDDDDNGYVDDAHGYDFTDAPGSGGFGDVTERDPDPSDEEGHGTHVAGILCADGSLLGVAPFVHLMAVRAAYTTPFGGILQTDDAAAAIVYAVDNGARILNLSWGDGEESRLVHEAVAYALGRGAVVVAAAGNGATAAAHFPSDQPGVLGVGAVDGMNARSGFSNFGPGVALYAPGERFAAIDGGIESLAPGGGRAMARGTSMAAPHVAGVAAIVMSRADRPDAERTRALLRAGARHGSGAALERGVLDAVGAVQAQDPALLEVTSPGRAFQRGRLTLVGSVTGNDVARWRVDARPQDSDGWREIVAWRTDRVVADTLADVGLDGTPEGAWEWVLAAETGGGLRRQVQGGFRIDFTPPGVDTLSAIAGWRGAEPHWLFTAAVDEEASMQVACATLVHRDPGLTRRLQVETETSAAGLTCDVSFENSAGLTTQSRLDSPPSLLAWPGDGLLMTLDSSTAFRPSPIWGAGRRDSLVVWGVGQVGDSVTTVQAWGVAGDRLQQRFDSHAAGRVAGYADVDADSSSDLLVQDDFAAEWWLAPGRDAFPVGRAARVPVERVLGLFQLDDDAAFETLLSSRDTLYLYDDLRTGAPVLMQSLVNPVRTGFNVWGATAAVGDLDGDGAIELVCGDAQGRVVVFERQPNHAYAVETILDTGGTYAYEIAAAASGRGFVVGRQRSRDPGGDGFPTVAYDFITFQSTGFSGGVWQAASTMTFLGAENDLRAGMTIDATHQALVRGGDLYLAAATDGSLLAHVEGAAGEAPVMADLDADGAVEIVLRTPGGARLMRREAVASRPHDLSVESLGAGRLRLEWIPGANLDAVWRQRADVWQLLGTTTSGVWVDSVATAFTDFDYEVHALPATNPAAISNRVRAHSQPLPRLVDVAPLGGASLRLRCSNPLRPQSADPQAWEVRDTNGVIPVAQVTLVAAGREADLLLAAGLVCGDVSVRGLDLRDDQGGRMQPSDATVTRSRECVEPAFAVTTVEIIDNTVQVRFGAAVDPTTVDAARFTLLWDGTSVPLAGVELPDPETVRLLPAAGVRFAAVGLPYRLRIDSGVRGLDGATLAHPELDYALYVQGRGASQTVPTPNPVRPGDTEVVFVEAGPETRVEIFDLEGQRIRSLTGAVGGGLRWDLRGGGGERVASGTYVYIARDGTGTRTGHVVVVR